MCAGSNFNCRINTNHLKTTISWSSNVQRTGKLCCGFYFIFTGFVYWNEPLRKKLLSWETTSPNPNVKPNSSVNHSCQLLLFQIRNFVFYCFFFFNLRRWLWVGFDGTPRPSIIDIRDWINFPYWPPTILISLSTCFYYLSSWSEKKMFSIKWR